MLNNESTSQKVKAEIPGSMALKKWLREGLDSFTPSKARDEMYEKELKGKAFFNLSPHEMGFGKAALNTSPASQKIEQIL